MSNQYYNVIYSQGSKNSCSGHGKIALHLITESEIISAATIQANYRGTDLIEYTDIEQIDIVDDDGDVIETRLSRDWEDGEELAAAIEEITHDGYLYEIFKCGDEDAEFIARAKDFNLAEKAREFVK